MGDPSSSQGIKRLRLRSPAYFAAAGLFTMLVLMLAAGAMGALLGMPFGPTISGVLGVVTGLGSGIAWAGWMWPKKLALGADGVLVSSWLGRSIVRFETIATARFEAGGWCFALHDGTELRFATDWTEDEQAVATELLEHAIAAHPPREREPADLDAWLGRSGQTTEAWISGLRRLLSQATQGYRSAVPDRETLREILLRGTAPADQRVAAAVALCADGHGDERAHVRVASDVTIQPELQEAFRIIAEQEDDEAVGQALEAMEKMTADRPG